MTDLEFPRQVDLREIRDAPVKLEAAPEERAALARRFGVITVERLEAAVTLERVGDDVMAQGRLTAAIVQSCAVTGDDLAVAIDEPLAFRFVPESSVEAEEIELDSGDLDEIPYSGTTLELGEAVAQSLALAIDPFATGPEADRVRKEAGLQDEAASGPFAALAALKASKK